MAAKTLSTYIGELSAGSSLGAGDKIPVLEGGAMVYFEGSGFQATDADLTTIAGLTPSNDDFLQRKAGAWANRTIAQVKTDLGVPTYARYVALLSQSGTDAPVATVLENTLGGTVVWTRADVGDYVGTLSGVFTGNKTFMLAAVNGETSSAAAIIPYTIGINSIGFYSMDAANNTVDLSGGAFFEIRVYP